jgi:hypothetical protein
LRDGNARKVCFKARPTTIDQSTTRKVKPWRKIHT